MFRQNCVAMAVGLALMHWAAAGTAETITVTDDLSLNDVQHSQTQTHRYDQNVIYDNTIKLNGQGGEKNLTIDVMGGQGSFTINNRRDAISLSGSNVHLTLNGSLVMDGSHYQAIDISNGNNKTIDISGDLIYTNAWGPAVNASNGASAKDVYIRVGGKAQFSNIRIGGENHFPANTAVLNLRATNFEAQGGIEIDTVSLEASNDGPVIFVQSGSLKAGDSDIIIRNITSKKRQGLATTSMYAQESDIVAGNILVENFTDEAGGGNGF